MDHLDLVSRRSHGESVPPQLNLVPRTQQPFTMPSAAHWNDGTVSRLPALPVRWNALPLSLMTAVQQPTPRSASVHVATAEGSRFVAARTGNYVQLAPIRRTRKRIRMADLSAAQMQAGLSLSAR